MKLVKDLKITGIHPSAGCKCSSGRTDTRGPWDPIWNCECQCDGGDTNYNYNHRDAKNA